MDKKQFSILLVSSMILAFFGAFFGTIVAFKEIGPKHFNHRPFPHFMKEQMDHPPTMGMERDFEIPDAKTRSLIEEQERFIDKAEDDFEDMMEHAPTPARLVLISSGGIKTQEMKDAFKVTVDLKPFNNDEKNIKVNTHGDKIFISAKYRTGQNGDFKSSQLHQMLTFPVKIDTAKIKKQKEGNSLVIIIPKK